MGPTARGGLIALASIIAVCGALLLWVERNSAAPLDFIERHLGFSPDDGDGSMEVLLRLDDRHFGGVPLGLQRTG